MATVKRRLVEAHVPSFRELDAEAKLENVRAYVADIRVRAATAPATSMALTYRFVADELEKLING